MDLKDYIVIGNFTVMDGYVIRWYASEVSATHGKEAISASRNGVIGGTGVIIDQPLFEAATQAHEIINRAYRNGRPSTDDFKNLVTHTRSFDEITKIKKDGE